MLRLDSGDIELALEAVRVPLPVPGDALPALHQRPLDQRGPVVRHQRGQVILSFYWPIYS